MMRVLYWMGMPMGSAVGAVGVAVDDGDDGADDGVVHIVASPSRYVVA
jgi:hypothetical protein